MEVTVQFSAQSPTAGSPNVASSAYDQLKAEKEELQGKVQSLLARVKWLESIVDWQAVGNCASPDSDRGAREPEEGEML